MIVFYFFAAIVVWLGILSLRGGFIFAAYVRRDKVRLLPAFTPFASVIAPCCGLEAGLRENLTALFAQDYPRYEIIFVTDQPDDSAVGTIEDLRDLWRDTWHTVTRHVVAGPAREGGQKVHNLRAAVSQVDRRSEVLVFVDSDGRPQPNWLQALVAPLANDQLGATTGYRWFIPENSGFASQLRSVWNASIASALGEREDRNFCWGGSTAIRRSTFDRLKVSERWRGTVSDDFTLTRVLQEAKLPIHFVPGCLVPSFGDCTVGELLEFSNRQLKITRVYAAHLWRAALIGSLLFSAVFFGGLILVITRAILHLPYFVPLAVLLLIYVLGAAKAYIRLQAIALSLQSYQKQISQGLRAHLLLWPFASALFLCNAVAAVLSRRISWRGITYELNSPTEAVIISRESDDL